MGIPTFPLTPVASFPAGVDLGTNLVLPTGSNPIYLRSVGPRTAESAALSGRIVTTLAAAAAQVRSGAYDTIVVLPGHSESVSTATALSALVAGTRIIGIGRGSNMPVFRWTATAAQWAISVADVHISGLRLRLEGANGVVKAINITGADCRIEGCDIEVASGAALKATIGIEIGTGADRTEIIGNRFRGTATHNVTDGVLVAAAVDGVRIAGNEMIFSATAANGCIRFSAAATGSMVRDNLILNTMTSSTACIAYGNVAATGVLAYNAMGTLNDGTVTDQGATFGAAALIRCFQNFSCDEPKKSGTLTPAAGT